MSMAERIYQKRIENNMTMEELANRLNVGKSAVNKWEKGHVTNIKRETIQKMADIFGCSPAWLMGLDDTDATTNIGYPRAIIKMAFPDADEREIERLMHYSDVISQFCSAPEDVQHTIEMILKSVPPKS